MRILLCSYVFAPSVGGIETVQRVEWSLLYDIVDPVRQEDPPFGIDQPAALVTDEPGRGRGGHHLRRRR